MSKQSKRAKCRRQNVQCPICGRMFSGQGLSGHMRFVHHMPATVSSKRLQKAKIKIHPTDTDERTPYLVKPLMSYEELVKRVNLDIELLDHNQASPCCKGTLRSAKRVLGILDSALDKCYICAQCGEWYHEEDDPKKPIIRLRNGKITYQPKLTHLIQEVMDDRDLDLLKMNGDLKDYM